ncbi:UDP-GlcNAc:betaGal beta-1,3-N-acetylglucosaminyltransferase-like protein 1 isoform X2 [Varroa destructor]|uniref:Glycosyltransferase 2-like domain-containing protein n=1 Tax=Varroa destructor TaxID=109461 RepID=A0A7M7K0B3_VARDE|nr:UDP-GlcNAc:betaGal beta-1,3-N-acetylglucosaminyltransferase-like protein 1 isoform X2 [Varroa destructor]XP_022659477.1 UDP-GlcNAc:betaGal beta-1,3-N-acetylglucosaminyltransferase-like protein 1 isoform X2 [Varroa destructor]XP_022659478.1 UDP-GlcNAc:betaGal beta-1,3-N-acetylglucosaminyltransferase-like protein 1 isoform X2 [Varroa destructor]
MAGPILISVIIPVHNSAKYLKECLDSILTQTFPLSQVEVSVWDDCSTDNSLQMVEEFRTSLENRGGRLVIGGSNGDQQPKGCGFAKNKAIEQSSGEFLCFLDSDDVIAPRRLEAQLAEARKKKENGCDAATHGPQHVLVGSRFHRIPEASTARYTQWANTLPQHLLDVQVFTSHGPTIIMPTWFCARETYSRIPGGFSEQGKGTPEDLIFFYKHLDLGGSIRRVDEDLLMYRYHPNATTFSISEETIWELRLRRLEERLLICPGGWQGFTIWNAGKQGKRFYRGLCQKARSKVRGFCDVDPKKIARGEYVFEESPLRPKPRLPIVHFTQVRPPLVICVKINLMPGGFEENLASLGLTEGRDYVHFA